MPNSARSPRFAFLVMSIGLVSTLLASVIGASAGQEIQVDLPVENAVFANGDLVNIGGWTVGSRVDAYLDGPPGVGRGLGTTLVNKPRPDVSVLTGRSDSGFDLPWAPTDVSDGPHTLYVYSLINGTWVVQTVPLIGEGNFYQPAMDDGRGMDRGSDSDRGGM